MNDAADDDRGECGAVATVVMLLLLILLLVMIEMLMVSMRVLLMPMPMLTPRLIVLLLMLMMLVLILILIVLMLMMMLTLLLFGIGWRLGHSGCLWVSPAAVADNGIAWMEIRALVVAMVALYEADRARMAWCIIINCGVQCTYILCCAPSAGYTRVACCALGDSKSS